MNKSENPRLVIILGSAPDSSRCIAWNKETFEIIAINNAWKIRDDWDYHIYPEDFPNQNHPPKVQKFQKSITAKEYVPEQNKYGGFIYAGGTMAFTAAYWALGTLQPDVLAFLGCDMVYPTDGGKTHFYGTGTADPLREDLTLQSLEAKSQRLKVLATQQSCLCVNLSELPLSKLLFSRVTIHQLNDMTNLKIKKELDATNQNLDLNLVKTVLSHEKELGYFVPSGKYWEQSHNFSRKKLAEIDNLWLETSLIKVPATARYSP